MRRFQQLFYPNEADFFRPLVTGPLQKCYDYVTSDFLASGSQKASQEGVLKSRPSVSFHGLNISPPVVLAPMAGVTSYPYRSICREFGAALFVSEMVLAHTLVEGNREALKLAQFGPLETPRSIQLAGSNPDIMERAARLLVEEIKVDHIDLNFGCPVKKITSRGYGSIIPLHPHLLRDLIRAVVRGVEGRVPVTIKIRAGVDDTRLTYLTAGQIAQDEGCAAVMLHSRTAAQLYSGKARWHFIKSLVHTLTIPVLGNGDIWRAQDALAMMDETGCAGVVIGRGCLGRPWLYRDLTEALAGRAIPDAPLLGESVDTMLKHAHRMHEWYAPGTALLAFRKFIKWYLQGYPNTEHVLTAAFDATSLEQLHDALQPLDRSTPLVPDWYLRPTFAGNTSSK